MTAAGRLWFVNVLLCVMTAGELRAQCNPPVITQQPHDVVLTATNPSPGTSVGASGTSLQYQWYWGNRGDTSQPALNGTGSSITLSNQDLAGGGARTGPMWVRVSSGCGAPPADSVTISVKASVAWIFNSTTNPSVVGQTLTINIEIDSDPYALPGLGGSTVSVSEGSTSLGSVFMSGFGVMGKAAGQFSTSSLSVGTHVLTFSFPGNAAHWPSTTTYTQIVKAAAVPTSTTMSSSPNPSIYSDPITYTAHVSPSDATGKVDFFGCSGTIGAGTGTATCTTAVGFGVGLWPAETVAMTAIYRGDANHLDSQSPIYPHTFAKAPVSGTVDSTSNPAFFGNRIIFTATFGGRNGYFPVGQVTFKDGATVLGSSYPTTANGVATFSTTSLSVGTHAITANLDADCCFSGATPVLNQVVIGAGPATTPTSVLVQSSPNPANAGQPVTFSATVNPPDATGTVSFLEGTTTLGTASVSGGMARYSTSSLSVGTHSVTASYNGDATHQGSTSSPVAQVIRAGGDTSIPTSISLRSAPNPSTAGQNVAFTASVTPVDATGMVLFSEGMNTLGSATLSGGVATYNTASLGGGNHSITATYNGDATHQSSTSLPLVHSVGCPSLTQSPNITLVAPTCASGVCAFGVATTGFDPGSCGLSFAWQIDGQNVPGAGSSFTYPLSDGPHTVRVAVSSGSQSLMLPSSGVLSFTVAGALTLTLQDEPMGGGVYRFTPGLTPAMMMSVKSVTWDFGNGLVMIVNDLQPVANTFRPYTPGMYRVSATLETTDGQRSTVTTDVLVTAPRLRPAHH